MSGAANAFASALWPTRALGVAEVDATGAIAVANDVLATIAEDDPRGRPFVDLVAPNQRAAVDALLRDAGASWSGLTVGLAPDENGVPGDFDLWARREGERTLVVAEPHVQGVEALNTQLLRLNDDLITARRDASRAAESERSARGRAEAAAERLRNLQRIVDTTLTGLSLDELLDELLGRVCDALTADAAEVLLLSDDDTQLVVRADRGLPERDRDDYAFSAEAGLAGQTLAAGRPLEVQPAADGEAAVSRALTGKARSLLSFPLRTRGQAVGVLIIGARDERVFAPADVQMLELAADRIATAIERVIAFERERSVATILQDSLMPGDIPALPGLDAAARYRPAGVGHRVGGDFYDVFTLPGGRSAAVVGDVRGKGPEAAAWTALVRFTVRALAPREESPEALLGELNSSMLEQSGKRPRHCTIVYATFRAAESGVDVELSCGGHPLPLVVRTDGTVEEIGAPGSLVGLLDQVTHRRAAARIAPGELVLFYTDGVTEAHHGADLFGEGRLAALLAECRGLGPAAVAERVEHAVEAFNDGPLRDDIAIVAVRAR